MSAGGKGTSKGRNSKEDAATSPATPKKAPTARRPGGKRKPGKVVHEHDPDEAAAALREEDAGASPPGAQPAGATEPAPQPDPADATEPPVSDPPSEAAAAGTGDDVLLQDWAPLSQCLDWKLARSAWAISADELFEDQHVPNLTHDSGALSVRNARLLLRWCEEQAAAGTLPERITVVEIGMGTGLHLRYLLDHFRDLCAQAEVGFYDRLAVFASDVSMPVLQKARDRGLFDAHGEKVRLGWIDLLTPGIFADAATGEQVDLRGQIHLLCANYVLDLLPFDVFRRRRVSANGSGQSTHWEALLVRTWLRSADRLPAYTDLTLEQVQTLAASEDPQAWLGLTSLYTLLQLEPRAFEVAIASHPDLRELVRVADGLEEALGPDHPLLAEGTVVYHSGGALRAALEMGRALADNGYAILRDVALTSPEMTAVARVHTHFGSTVAAGVNMVQFDTWFAQDGSGSAIRSLAARNDGIDHQAVRMLTRAQLPGTVAHFEEIFDGQGIANVALTVQQARAETDPAAAMERYRQALVDEPGNWLLLGEAAACALSAGLVPDLALVIARQGLEVNPGYSPDLWNIYGDALWAAGDSDNARLAYEAALQTNPRHPRTHYCLAWAQAERGRFDVAFKHIGEALAHDPAGLLRAEVLQLLDLCLRGQQMAWEAEQQRLATRAAR